MTSPWLQTVSGIAYDLLEPDPDSIRLDDVAHALARICRYTGHVKGHPYSVAQHSVIVAQRLAFQGEHPAIVRAGLLHDAHEAVTGDVASPIKRAIGPAWAAFEAIHERAFADRFGLTLPHEDVIKRADLRALMTEARCLLGPSPRPPGDSWPLAEPWPEVVMIRCWTAGQAKAEFLAACERWGVQ